MTEIAQSWFHHWCAPGVLCSVCDGYDEPRAAFWKRLAPGGWFGRCRGWACDVAKNCAECRRDFRAASRAWFILTAARSLAA